MFFFALSFFVFLDSVPSSCGCEEAGNGFVRVLVGDGGDGGIIPILWWGVRAVDVLKG